MPRTSARSEPLQSPTQQFPPFARAGNDAAALLFQSAPLSMGEFRDLRFRSFIAGLDVLDDYAGRRRVFNEAFARGIALAIVSASRSA
jgi:hypothetical protein